jgi:hypothetical protein
MTTTQRLILPLRIALVLAFAFALVMQALATPGELMEHLGKAPEYAHLHWAYFLVAELELLGFQVLIVCTWKLLTMIRKDRIFSDESSTWVNLIVRTVFTGWVVFAVFSAYVVAVIYFTPEIRDPGIPMMLFGMLLVGAVVVMLIVVMRTLQRQATSLRGDLDEVI